MTASPNVQLVRSICAAWERGDFSRNDWADPDIEFIYRGGLGGGSTGIPGMGEAWGFFLGAFDEWQVIPTQYHELDQERVLVFTQGVGHGKSSGISVEHDGAALFHIQDGRVTRLIAYPERERALADLGLNPEGEKL